MKKHPSPTVSEPGTIALNSQLVGNVGLYYCCYRLSLLGWNVMPTARNARGVDIIAYNENASRLIGIQVKALSKPVGVRLGQSIDKVMGDFWIVVVKAGLLSHESFVLVPDEVKERAVRQESKKEGKVSFWLSRNQYGTDQFREKWERIGTGGLEARPPQTGEFASPSIMAGRKG